MEFEDQIRQKLIGLNHKQLCQFAWLCGLRALPFLSVEENFAYWRNVNRGKYLYNIFYALDFSAADVVDAAYAAYALGVAYASGAANATSAAKSASAATNAAHADKATAYAAAYAAKAKYINYFNLKSVLLKDIEAIKRNKLDECNHDVKIYYQLWDRFQEDLKAIGCAYWAEFYENLFNNGFVIDKRQLKRRLGVPDEIKAEGAEAVGPWAFVFGITNRR